MKSYVGHSFLCVLKECAVYNVQGFCPSKNYKKLLVSCRMVLLEVLLALVVQFSENSWNKNVPAYWSSELFIIVGSVAVDKCMAFLCRLVFESQQEAQSWRMAIEDAIAEGLADDSVSLV